MLEIDFERYLSDDCHLEARTVAARLANCKRVERYEGDLDGHFERDGLMSLIQGLSYSKEDENQNKTSRHSIPIDGNVRNGSATLKQAVGLYLKFRMGAAHSRRIKGSTSASDMSTLTVRRDWPNWPQPDDVDIFQLASVITPLVRFLHPSIVGRVVDDNAVHQTGWSAEFQRLGLDLNTYLWEGSPCAFPGVRRYSGSQEIAQFRGKSADPARSVPDCLSLDDNDYPKHLWAFVFTNKPFRKKGPPGYQLAHLADHKEHNNRWQTEFAVESSASPPPLFGLYTSPANLAYVPSNFLKPTDFSGTLRTLLLRKAYQLYGDVARLAPPPLIEKTEEDSQWHPDNFPWEPCVGTTEHVDEFLRYRSQRMDQLIEASGKTAARIENT